MSLRSDGDYLVGGSEEIEGEGNNNLNIGQGNNNLNLGQIHSYKVNFRCRVCGKIGDNIEHCKKWHHKDNKIFSFLGKQRFSNDTKGLHSELICSQCHYKATKVVKRITESRKNKDGLTKDERVQEAREKESWPQYSANFEEHLVLNCPICIIDIQVPNVESLPSKSPLKRIFQTVSPQESPVKRTPRGEKPKRKMTFVEISPGQPEKRRKITVGNQSIHLNQFKNRAAARLMRCQVCRGVPSSPMELPGCRHIYCSPDCIEEWKAVASSCKHSECLQSLSSVTFCQLSGERHDFYCTLEVSCKYCKVEMPVAELTLHQDTCIDKNKRGKNKNLRTNIQDCKMRTARKYLTDVSDKMQDFCVDNDQNSVQATLRFAEMVLKDNGHLAFAEELVAMAKKILNGSNSNVINKMSPAEQGALRKAATISNDQLIAISDFCHSLEKDYKEKGFDPHLNPFNSYRTVHKEDVSQMPSNVTFKLLDKNSSETVLQHDPVLESHPRNILEDFDPNSSEEVAPNISGCFFPPTLVAAKELEGMASTITESFDKLLPGESSHDYVFHVVTKISEDGLGQIPETRSTEERHLPTKIFKATQVILMVFVLKGEEKVVLWRNPAPNSQFEPATFNVYADESDNYSMAVITQKMDFYVEELRNHLLEVSSLKFDVRVYVQRDGKWWVRSTGTAGPTHTFNCTRCFVEAKDVDVLGDPREPVEHNKLAVEAIWNVNKEDPMKMYNKSKGAAKVGLSQVETCRVCPDELHLDLNIAENYDHSVPLMMTFCHQNDRDTPKLLKWRCHKKHRKTHNHNKAVWKQHKRSVIGIGQTVQSKSSNPGEVARMTLSTDFREQLFSLIPNCEVKKRFLESLSKLDAVRDITGAMWPTDEQIDSYSLKVTEWVDHRKQYLPWMSNTNVVHILRCHVDPILKDKMGPQSIMALSSSQLESQNAQVRRCIKYMSFKGLVYRQTEDCLRHAYLSGTWVYKSLIRKHKLDRAPFQIHRCSVCGEQGHNIRTCPVKTREFDDGFQAEVTVMEEREDASQLLLNVEAAEEDLNNDSDSDKESCDEEDDD